MNPAKLLTEFRHLGITLAGIGAELVEFGVLHGEALHWTQLATAVLTAVCIGKVQNVPHPAARKPKT